MKTFYPEEIISQRTSQTVDLAFNSLAKFDFPEPEIFHSAREGCRMRAEFRIWHEGSDLHYVMFESSPPHKPFVIETFPIASTTIQSLMPKLLGRLKTETVLRKHLFQAEFLSTSTGECLVTLIYRRVLDKNWELAATELAKYLNIHIVGRSRKKQLVIGQEYVTEKFCVEGRDFLYRQYEQTFSQPNFNMNQMMLIWASKVTSDASDDLLELYCGSGNFTIPLSKNFRRIIATEVSKRAIRAAKENLYLNGVANIDLVRMSASETSDALSRKRLFRRLDDLAQDLSNYELKTLLVDPPRAGMDAHSLEMASKFDRIIYFSCSLDSFKTNMQQLFKTHDSRHFAMFDQFPGTSHIELATVLQKAKTTTS